MIACGAPKYVAGRTRRCGSGYMCDDCLDNVGVYMELAVLADEAAEHEDVETWQAAVESMMAVRYE